MICSLLSDKSCCFTCLPRREHLFDSEIFMSLLICSLWDMDNVSSLPLYQQIEGQIKEAIFVGELKDEDILLSIRNLANDLQVSVLTIRRVYDELEKKGFLVCHVGVGSFISTDNLETLKDWKRRVVKQKMSGINKEELDCMIDILYKEE